MIFEIRRFLKIQRIGRLVKIKEIFTSTLQLFIYEKISTNWKSIQFRKTFMHRNIVVVKSIEKMGQTGIFYGL